MAQQKPPPSKPQRRTPRQQKPRAGEPPAGAPPVGEPLNPWDPVPEHDCSDCTIVQIAPYPPFPGGRRSGLRLPLSVSATSTLTLTAVPSDPLCPCEWRNDFQIAGHWVMTGSTTMTRTTLNAGPSPLIETLRPRLDRLTPFFTLAGCTLTINVHSLDQTLRQGIGLANNVVMIEMGLQVRCSPKGRWRNIRIVFSD